MNIDTREINNASDPKNNCLFNYTQIVILEIVQVKKKETTESRLECSF